MPDPNYIGQNSDGPRLPDEWRAKYLARPVEQLPRDVTHAFDKIDGLRKEKDALMAQLLRAQRRLDVSGIKLWVMGIFLAAEGAALGILFEIVMKK